MTCRGASKYRETHRINKIDVNADNERAKIDDARLTCGNKDV